MPAGVFAECGHASFTGHAQLSFKHYQPALSPSGNLSTQPTNSVTCPDLSDMELVSGPLLIAAVWQLIEKVVSEQCLFVKIPTMNRIFPDVIVAFQGIYCIANCNLCPRSFLYPRSRLIPSFFCLQFLQMLCRLEPVYQLLFTRRE